MLTQHSYFKRAPKRSEGARISVNVFRPAVHRPQTDFCAAAIARSNDIVNNRRRPSICIIGRYGRMYSTSKPKIRVLRQHRVRDISQKQVVLESANTHADHSVGCGRCLGRVLEDLGSGTQPGRPCDSAVATDDREPRIISTHLYVFLRQHR
jgi:hypothetical protein